MFFLKTYDFYLGVYAHTGACSVCKRPWRSAGVIRSSELPEMGNGAGTQVQWKNSKQP